MCLKREPVAAVSTAAPAAEEAEMEAISKAMASTYVAAASEILLPTLDLENTARGKNHEPKRPTRQCLKLHTAL